MITVNNIKIVLKILIYYMTTGVIASVDHSARGKTKYLCVYLQGAIKALSVKA